MTADTTKNDDTMSLSYPGGKGLLYQRLISLIPPHDTYIEPFAGGGAVLRMKRPARVNIAIDADAEALGRLRWSIVRNGVGRPGITTESGEPAAQTDQSSPDMASGSGVAGNGDDYRYPSPQTTMGAAIVTNGEPVHPGPLAGNSEAIAALVRNGDTVGGSGAIVTAGEATRLDSWQFLNTDALAWLDAYPWRGDEFLYCDPPYLMETRKQKRAIYRYEMSRAQHCRLLLILTRLPCKLMASGYYSDLYAEAFQGWHTRTFETTTRGGSPATEWVWMNYPPPVALHDYRYLGDGFRERERIRRKTRRWVEKLRKMDILEKQAILAAIEEAGL